MSRVRLGYLALLFLAGCGHLGSQQAARPTAVRQAAAPQAVAGPFQSEQLVCTIRGQSACSVGEAPKLSVELSNLSAHELTLPGVLDGSSDKVRYPHCYFEIENPKGWSPPADKGLMCGVLNSLKFDDFVRLLPGETWEIDSSRRLTRHFTTPGEYRLRYVYSTAAEDLKAWDGYPRSAVESGAVMLFRQTPKLEVKSEVFVVTVTESIFSPKYKLEAPAGEPELPSISIDLEAIDRPQTGR